MPALEAHLGRTGPWRLLVGRLLGASLGRTGPWRLLVGLGLILAFPGASTPAARAARGRHAARARPHAHGRHAKPRRRVRCSNRFGCAGKRPEEYDKLVRVIYRPRKGYDRGCLKRLRAAGIRYRLLARVKGVKTPVEVLSKRLGRVRYRKAWNNKRRFILDCHTVEALAAAGPALRKAGIASIYFTSTWRYSLVHHTHRLSKHAYGWAIDITAIDGAFGYASVVRHYERGAWGCGRRNHTPKGAAWRKLYCALKQGRFFSTIFTPDYNRNHRDHLHVERPNPRVRLLPKGHRSGAGARRPRSRRGRAHHRPRYHWTPPARRARPRARRRPRRPIYHWTPPARRR